MRVCVCVLGVLNNLCFSFTSLSVLFLFYILMILRCCEYKKNGFYVFRKANMENKTVT